MNNVNGTIQWARKCYGVDFQDGVPVVVCCDKSKGSSAFSEVSIKDDQFKKDLQKGVPFSAALSSRESLICRVVAPFDSLRKAKKVFSTLLDIQLPFALEDCTYEFLAAESKAGAVTALAVAGRKQDVENKLKLLDGFGIDPYVLDHEGLALWSQALKEVPLVDGATNEWRILVNINGKASNLTIGRGQDLLSCNSIAADNGGQIHRLLKSSLASAKDEASAGDARIRWIWVGAGSAESDKVSSIRSLLDKSFDGEHVFVDKPEVFLARALAVRALFAGPLRCNLRKGIISHGGVILRSRRRFALGVSLLLLSGAILCASNIFVRGRIDARTKALDSVYYSIAAAATGYDVRSRGSRGADVVKEVRTQVNKRKQLLSPFLSSVETSMLDTVSAIMTIADKSGLKFDAIQVDPDEVMITGTAPGWESCDELLVYLKSKGYLLTEDNLDRKDSKAGGRMAFRLMSGRVR